MASFHYGDLSHRSRNRSPSSKGLLCSFRNDVILPRIAPWNPPSDKKYTKKSSVGNLLSSPSQDEPSVPSNYDEDASFSSATTFEGCSSDVSFTFTVDDEPSQSVFISGNNHTKSEAASMVTEVPEINSKNNSRSGTLDQNSGFRFKFTNRSLPSLVSTPKRPWHHQLTVRVSMDTSLESC